MTGVIVKWDVDEAEYIGDDENGVYYQIAEGPGGWYMTAVVDTAHFANNLVTDDGPYATAEDAAMAGKNAAYEWCMDNEVAFDVEEEAN